MPAVDFFRRHFAPVHFQIAVEYVRAICRLVEICYLAIMRTVEEIKEAIKRLSPLERAELEAWLHPRLDHEWDSEPKELASTGKASQPKAKRAGAK